MTFLLLLLAFQSEAHQAGSSYLVLTRTAPGMTGQWKAAVRDLDMALSLDSNQDGSVTWGELRRHRMIIEEYFVSHVVPRSEGKVIHCNFGNLAVEEINGEMFAVLSFAGACQPVSPIEINYTAFFDWDAGHRGILEFTGASGSRLSTFSPSHPIEMIETGHLSADIGKLVEDGIWHIWRGADHLLFLLSLLLPSVLWRDGRTWRAASGFKVTVGDITRTVTAFTVAHSITLALASLRIVELPSRIVEIAVAASVVFAALNNIFSWVSERRWIAAFGFGLLHGFGFASALTGLQVSGTVLAQSLLGFNLGVELGQITIVAGLLPLIFLARTTRFYRGVGLQLGSAMIAILASVWIWERVFIVKIVP